MVPKFKDKRDILQECATYRDFMCCSGKVDDGAIIL